MIIHQLDSHWISCALALFNTSIQHKELLYKPLSLDDFKQKFQTSDPSLDVKTILDVDSHQLIGFMSGVIVKDKNKAYITTIVVDSKYRRKGVGSNLLHQFESYVANHYPSIPSIDIIFFNPMQFEWIIPKTNNHDHPNAPGVDMDRPAFHFFIDLGYKEYAKQNSYYKNIEQYSFRQDIIELIDDLSVKNIKITFFNPDFHQGFDELFENLKNPYWNDEIRKASINHEPILVATIGDKIIGFTGPLRVQSSKRGYFAGIGVHSDYRGHSIGKVLFASLCYELKILGAHFMTLFTGETNPARKIYEREGFMIVKSWANMKKEIIQ